MAQTRRDVLASIGTLTTLGLGTTRAVGMSRTDTTLDGSNETGMTSDSGSNDSYGDVTWSDSPGGDPTEAVVAGDTLFLGVTTVGTERRDNGKVVAYDRTTGAIKWSHTGIGSVDEALTVANGTVYVAADGVTRHDHPHEDTGTPGVFALDADTGETQWRNDATKTWGLVHVAGDRVYATSHDSTTGSVAVYVIDADTGTTITTYDLVSAERSTDETKYRVTEFTVVDETMYLAIEQSTKTGTEDNVATYSHATNLLALDANSGDQLWMVTVDAKPIGMAFSDGFLYLTAESNRVYRFSTDGTQSWAKRLYIGDQEATPTAITAPRVANGTVHVGTDDAEESEGRLHGAVHALEAATGATQWRFETAAHVNCTPVVDGDFVYVGAAHPSVTSGHAKAVVYALNRSDGSERWSYATESTGYPDMPQWAAIDGMIPVNGHLYLWTNTPHVEPQHYDYRVYALTGSDERPAPEHRVEEDSAQTTSPGDGTDSDDGNESESGDESGGEGHEPDEQQKRTSAQTADQRSTTSTSRTTARSNTTVTRSTATRSSTTPQTSDTRSITASNREGTPSRTSQTSGQPGFEILTSLGGLAGIGSYLLTRKEGGNE